jgi:hypothetical protein
MMFVPHSSLLSAALWITPIIIITAIWEQICFRITKKTQEAIIVGAFYAGMFGFCVYYFLLS